MENKALILKNLSKSYGDRVLFEGLSRELEFGKIYALTGGNGRGKTTLFKILLGLISADSGEAFLGSRPLIPDDSAVAFQEHRLFGHLSAERNVSLICGSTEKARELLSYFGFSEADMKKKPRALSGGMKQAVSISRALAAERSIILLDEASKELDKDVKGRLYEKLSELKKDRLIIMITHDSEDISFSDEEISLDTFLPKK